jgi:hypothetical protein
MTLFPILAWAGASDVVACRKIADSKERLACFDRTVEGLEIDLKSEARSPLDLFGFFSGGKVTADKDFGKTATTSTATSGEAGTPQPIPEITQIDIKLVDLVHVDGKANFYFSNGQVWVAQEARRFSFKGDGSDHAVIRRALVGYLIRVNDLSSELPVRRLK